jgi:hypothetical protein
MGARLVDGLVGLGHGALAGRRMQRCVRRVGPRHFQGLAPFAEHGVPAGLLVEDVDLGVATASVGLDARSRQALERRLWIAAGVDEPHAARLEVDARGARDGAPEACRRAGLELCVARHAEHAQAAVGAHRHAFAVGDDVATRQGSAAGGFFHPGFTAERHHLGGSRDAGPAEPRAERKGAQQRFRAIQISHAVPSVVFQA